MIVVIAFVALHVGIIAFGKKLDTKRWSVTTVGAIVAVVQTIFMTVYLFLMQMPPLR
jgi:hypothetical protein